MPHDSESTPTLPPALPAHSANDPAAPQPNAEQLEQVLQLYDAGRYRDAFHYTLSFKPIEAWKGVKEQTLAGRLAQNFGRVDLAMRSTGSPHGTIQTIQRSLTFLP